MSKLPIVIASKRTGSTIVQNIGHIICTGNTGALPKRHSVQEPKNQQIITIVRDPRDVAISMYRTHVINKPKFDKIIDLKLLDNKSVMSNIRTMQKMYLRFSTDETVLNLRYEDIFKDRLGDYTELIKLITKFVGVENTPKLNKEINDKLHIDKIKKLSDKIVNFNKHTLKADEVLYIHGSHIETVDIKTWRDKISPELVDKYNDKLKRYITTMGYEI